MGPLDGTTAISLIKVILIAVSIVQLTNIQFKKILSIFRVPPTYAVKFIMEAELLTKTIEFYYKSQLTISRIRILFKLKIFYSLIALTTKYRYNASLFSNYFKQQSISLLMKTLQFMVWDFNLKSITWKIKEKMLLKVQSLSIANLSKKISNI